MYYITAEFVDTNLSIDEDSKYQFSGDYINTNSIF